MPDITARERERVKGIFQMMRRTRGARAAEKSPRVLHGICHYLLTARRHFDREVDRAVVDLLEVPALARDLPVRPAEEVLAHEDLRRLLLVVAHLDLERFRN